MKNRAVHEAGRIEMSSWKKTTMMLLQKEEEERVFAQAVIRWMQRRVSMEC